MINPCPFCKSENVQVYEEATENGLIAEGFVFCASCRAQGPLVSNLELNNPGAGLASGDEVEDMCAIKWNAATSNFAQKTS